MNKPNDKPHDKPVNDLTFAELRLANLVHPHASSHPQRSALRNALKDTPLEKLDDTTLAQALAEMMIQIDWMAASRGIDLVLAIRNCFAIGDTHDLERERPGD